MRWWLTQRSVVVALAVALGLVATALLVLHTGPVRTIVGQRLASALAPAGLSLTIDRLDYNILTLRATAHGVVLGAAGHPTAFFRADRIEARLDSSVVIGGVHLRALDVSGARLALRRDAGGGFNLPAGAGPAEPGGTTTLPIDRLAIDGLDVEVSDESAGWTLAIDDLTADLRPEGGAARGNVEARGPVSLAWNDERLEVSRLAAAIAFDGRDVEISNLVVDAGDARVDARGRLSAVLGDAVAELDVDGSVDLARVSSLLDLDPAVAGQAGFSASARGPLGNPTIRGNLSLDAVAFHTIEGLRARAGIAFADGRLDLEPVVMEVAGGRTEGSAIVIVGEDRTTTRATLRLDSMAIDPLVDLASAEPVPVGGRVSGSLEVGWAGAGWRGLDVSLDVTTTSRGSSRPLGLDGRLSLTASGGQWRASARQRVARSIDLVLDARGDLGAGTIDDSTLRGSLAVSIPDLGPALDSFDTAAIVSRPGVEPIEGSVRVDLDLGGTFAHPAAEGALDVMRARLGALGPVTMTGRLDVTASRLVLDALSLASPQASGSGRVSVALAREGLAGDLDVSVASLESFLPDTTPLLVRDPLRARVELAGSVGTPRLAVDLRSGSLAALGQPFDAISGRARYDGATLTVEDVRLSKDEGVVDVSGHYTPAADRFAGSVRVRSLVLRPVTRPEPSGDIALGGTLDLDFQGAGTLASPAGSGRLTVAGLTYGERQLGSLAAVLTLADGDARVEAEAPDLPARLDAQVSLEAPHPFTARIAVADADLADLARRVASQAAESISGRASVDVTASGRLDDPSSATTEVVLRRLEADVRGVPVAADGEARLRYERGSVSTPGLALRVGAGLVRAEGAFGDPGRTLSIDAHGDLADLAPTISALLPDAPALEGAGLVTARVEVGGSTQRATVTGRVGAAGARIGIVGQPLVQLAGLAVRLDDGVVVLDQLRASWQGANATVRGRLPLRVAADKLPAAIVAALPDGAEAATLDARIENLTEAALAPYVSAATLAELRLRAGAEIRVSASDASLDGLRGTVRVEPGEVTMAGVALRQEAPAVLQLEEGTLVVRDWRWRGPRSSFAFTGTAALGGEGALSVGVGGELDLRMLGAWVPAAVAGEAHFVIGLTGAIDDPTVSGEVVVRDGELRLADPRLVVDDLSGLIELSQHRLFAAGLTGTANGGPLRVAADITHEWFVPVSGRMTVEASEVALEPFQGLRTEIESDIALDLADGGSRLTGGVTVVRGAYREPLTILGQLLQRAGAPAARPADAGDRTFLEGLTLEVTLDTRDDLIVDNNVADLALGLDLTIVGTGARPSLVGRAAVREGGTLFLAGNAFQIEAGTIDFANPARIEPDLSIGASTRVGGDDIFVSISGTPETLRVDLASTSLLNQTDIVSLLVTGEKESDLGVEVARDQVLGFLTGEFLAVAGRAVGLDIVRFERGEAGQSYRFDPGLVATETDPASRLTLGKNLRRDLQIVYSQNLRESGKSTWIVSYKPLANIEIRGVVRDERDRSYEFRHDLSFGGRRRAAPRGPRRTSARVGEERFTGDTGVPTERLADLTKLDPGRRFDFYTWQADRERLERFYHHAGYREARVRPIRVPRPPDPDDGRETVDLEYRITQGPLTTIDVSGYELPASLGRRLETLWSEAVIDTFFVDEAERAVRAHLADRGYLQADLTGGLTTDAGGGVKTLALAIDAGPRTAERQVVVEGNAAMSSGRLRAMAASPSDWLEPETIARRVEDAYRQEGFFDAAVSVSGPAHEGDTARLDLRVAEGARYTVEPVRLEGTITRPVAEVEAALALEPGSVYTPAKAGAARTRLEADYRRLGFNRVRIDLVPELTRETATAVVRLVVDEGPQQIVAGVTVEGAERTASSLVARALSIRIGEPVDLTALYQSRRRLFATGVFRRVDLDLDPSESGAGEPGQRQVEPVGIKAVVEEWPAYRLRYGLGVNDERTIDNPETRTQTVGLVAELTRRNLFGRALSIGAAGRLERRQRVGRLFASAPMLFGLPIASQAYVSWLRNKLGEGTTRPAIRDVTSVSFEQRVRPWNAAVLSYAYAFERNHTFLEDPDPDDPFGDFKVDIARLTAALAVEYRDDPLDARRGWFHSSAFEYSSERLGSQLRFAKYFGTLNGYWSLPLGIVLASGSRVGVAEAFDQVLIPSERFFAGGGNSVRGYAQDAIGPSDYFGPLGGNALLVFNEEVRFPIWRIVSGVGFFDAGGVFDRVSEMSFRKLDASVGAGLRFNTPFGLFRLDYGRPLSREPDEPSGRWFFSIGQLF